MLSEIAYFEEPGKANTEETLKIAKNYSEEKGVKSLVVASTTGYTAERAAEILKGFNLVVITHVTGHREPNMNEFPSELRERLEAKGVRVVTAAHAFDGVNKLADAGSVGQIIRDTLRMFCEGMKVAVEISAMAADAGLLRTDEDAVSIGGTGRGADTALVLRPAISSKLFEMRIKRILAKPI